MSIYKINNKQTLQTIKENPFKLESELQSLTENNLEVIFGLELVTSEFALQDLRIDSLAFNNETKSFVIIEYKRDKNFSVIDQGYAYLALMLNNKADFILEYNEKLNKNLKRDDVDWSQSQVLFLANSFTTYQRNAINFKDLPFELWEVKKYDNETILYNQIKANNAKESIKKISSNENITAVSKEIQSYSIEDHIRNDWALTKELYEELSERIYKIDDRIEESPTKHYVGYKINKTVLFDIKIQKTKLILSLYRVKPENLKDPEKKVKYVTNSYKFYNKHVTDFYISNLDDIDYAIMLAKQVYTKYGE